MAQNGAVKKKIKIPSSYISIPIIIIFFIWLFKDVGFDSSEVLFMLFLCLFAWIFDDIKEYNMSRQWLFGIFFLPIIFIPIYFFKTKKWYAFLIFVLLYVIFILTILTLSFFNLYKN
jgi:hypothetical protein